MHNDEQDIRLWLQIRQDKGKLSAFRDLFNRYYTSLCRFAAYWLRDREAAEEIVLDVFTHLWLHAADIHIEKSVRAYLFRAVQHRALNRLRDSRQSYIPLENIDSTPTVAPDLNLELEEMMQRSGRP